jgi:hypothetical protein
MSSSSTGPNFAAASGGAHLADQTQTKIYQQDFARNTEIFDAVSNTRGHDEWNQRLNEAHQRLNLRQNPPQEPQPLSPEAPEPPTAAPAPEPDPTRAPDLSAP